jgi:hypothetical protein
MKKPMYANDDAWRRVVVLNLVGIRRSVHLLGFWIAVVVLGFYLSRWWPDAPVASAVCMCGAFVFQYLQDYKAHAALERLFLEADDGE